MPNYLVTVFSARAEAGNQVYAIFNVLGNGVDGAYVER